jgi:anti-sigma regulatory factor (Ser/Thr protein kinase)
MSLTVDVMHGSRPAGDLEQGCGVGAALHPDYLELAARPNAVACARLHARNMLWEWGLDWLAPDAELLVAELMASAIKAAAPRDETLVRLRLSSDGTQVLIEVWDPDPWPPAAAARDEGDRSDPLTETGRGLFLVAALSARWDWYPTREPRGKVVWCEIAALLSAARSGRGPVGISIGVRIEFLRRWS